MKRITATKILVLIISMTVSSSLSIDSHPEGSRLVLERLRESIKEEEKNEEQDQRYRHSYLQGELYSRIAGMDLRKEQFESNSGKQETRPSISIINADISNCVNSVDHVTLEFILPEEMNKKKMTVFCELVIKTTVEIGSDVMVISSKSAVGEHATIKIFPNLRNDMLVYDVSELVKMARDSNENLTRARGAVLEVNLHGGAFVDPQRQRRERTCSRFEENPPTLFLYHDFPADFREKLQESYANDSNFNTKAKRSVANHRTDCHLHQWTVDFRAIGMNWVIAPALFKVNYCHGSCADPSLSTTDLVMLQSGRITNHALILLKAQSSSAQSLPSPSCVPTAYDSMNMIFLDRDNTVRVETFRQMVATACGCGCK